MYKVIVFVEKGQFEFETDKKMPELAIDIYQIFPNCLGFTIKESRKEDDLKLKLKKK